MAMLIGGQPHVVDARDGAPIGVAQPHAAHHVLVEVPGGDNFLAGDAVHRVPGELGLGLSAMTPAPLSEVHLRPADRRNDRRWRRLE